MTLLALLLVALTPGVADEPDPARLVEQLAAESAAERDEAAGRLEEIGRPALPALNTLRAKPPDDPELLRRVDQLVELIERQRLTRATKVTLDADDRELGAVVASLHEQTGIAFSLNAPDEVKRKRVTVRGDGPIPLWQALDRLGRAGGVRFTPAPLQSSPVRGPTIRLVPTDEPPPPSDDTGPFRVVLARIMRHATVIPARGGAEPVRKQEFTVELQLLGEPGLTIGSNGPAVVEQAVDDQGHELGGWPIRIPRGINAVLPTFDQPALPLLSYNLGLGTPEGLGRTIRRLKGYLPIVVMARTSDPVVIPLTDAETTDRATPDGLLRVRRPTRRPSQTTIAVELTTKTPVPMMGRPVGETAPMGMYAPMFRIDDRIQICDAQGRPCRVSGRQSVNVSNGVRGSITVFAPEGGEPAELRYYSVVAAAIEVVFEFTDVAIP